MIDGLGRIGVLGMTAPKEFGGRGFSQMANCKVLEEIGALRLDLGFHQRASLDRHSRVALVWHARTKREMAAEVGHGEQLGAFALTEQEAGSDAANVQTTATPSEDGSHFILNGEKRYITNAAIAQVLTVMARTPVPENRAKTAITAFLVTPDMPGFEMIEPRMEKLGIRGTATGGLRCTTCACRRKIFSAR